MGILNKFVMWLNTSTGTYVWGLVNGMIFTFMSMFILSVFMGVKFGL